MAHSGTAPAQDRRARALQVGLEAVRTYGSDPSQPWALGHAMLALGADHRTADGRLAWQQVLEDDGRVATLAGQDVVLLDPGPDDHRVDPHPNAFLAIVLSAGVPLDSAFVLDGRSWTLWDVVRGAELSFRRPVAGDDWLQHGWTLRALALALGDPQASWTTAAGERVDLGREADRALAYLEYEHGFVADLVDRGGQLDKRRQYIYAHACGGLHLLTGALTPLMLPQVRATYAGRAAEQLHLLSWRLGREHGLYDQIAPGRESATDVMVAVQRLKVFGHSLEAMADLWLSGALPPDEADLRTADQLEAWTVDALLDLEARGAYASMDALKGSQTWLDLVGDTSHAVRGMALAERLRARGRP